MSNETDHAARIAGIQGRFIRAKLHGPCTAADVEFQQNSMLDVRYLLDRVSELQARVENAEAEVARMKASTQWDTVQTISEQLLVAESNVRTMTAERDAQREMLDLCAQNTAAADLAQEVEFVRTERDALRAEVARLGPVEWQCRSEYDGWHPCDREDCTNERRRIRVMQQQEGAGDA